MYRKYSIGFLMGIMGLIALFVFGYEVSYQNALDKRESERQESTLEEGYYVRDKDGYVTVYHKDGSVYEYTSILSKELPRSIQESMKSGIELENLTEVYGFLENYSS